MISRINYSKVPVGTDVYFQDGRRQSCDMDGLHGVIKEVIEDEKYLNIEYKIKFSDGKIKIIPSKSFTKYGASHFLPKEDDYSSFLKLKELDLI